MVLNGRKFCSKIVFVIMLMVIGSPVFGLSHQRLVPVLDGEPWTITGNPDLGEYTMERQQPVDFAIWQAADGTWQVCSCIRGTGCGGQTRLLYRWEGKNLTDTNWQPMGITLEAKTELGEVRGGLQAPHVIKQDGLYYMFYGTYEEVAKAVSYDGKTFGRIINPNGRTGIFGEGEGNGTRDPMLFKTNGLWYCYYTAHAFEKGYVYCRTSKDLQNWDQAVIVSCGGRFGYHATSHECPQVVEPVPGKYFLFATQIYGKNMRSAVFDSTNPLDFGIDNDTHYVTTLPVAAPEVFVYQGQYYIAYLLENLKGIQLAKLKWITVDQPMELNFDDPNYRAQWTIESGDLETTFTNAGREKYSPWSEYFISTERLKNGGVDETKKGVIISPPFELKERYYTLLMSGSWITSIFIIDADTGETLVKYSGRNGDKFRPIPFSTSDLKIKDKKVRIKIVDNGNDHTNFGGLYKDIEYNNIAR